MEFLKEFLRVRKYNSPKIKNEIVLAERAKAYLTKEKNNETENHKHLSKLSYMNDLKKYVENENIIQIDLKNLRLEMEMKIRKEQEKNNKNKVELIDEERRRVQEKREEKNKELEQIREALELFDECGQKDIEFLEIAANKIKKIEEIQNENILSAKYIVELIKGN